MSIKYNNKVIAGKYKEQVIPFANTIDAGIAKIATQEQINEGIDNTSIVTPVYLSQKQDKLTAGEGIDIDATNTISSKILPDKITIVENDNKTISTVARKTVNENIIYDWEGTQEEYQLALLNNEINPDWYCYITDDEQVVSYGDVVHRNLDNLSPEGQAKFDEKANIDFQNVPSNSVGFARCSTEVTNCITSIPNRIKYTLVDGVLTIIKGSVAVVPYGTEDLTSQFPVGSTFLHGNFKVYDTSWDRSKFFVLAELQADKTISQSGTYDLSVFMDFTVGRPVLYSSSADNSGDTSPTGDFYHTTLNTVKRYNATDNTEQTGNFMSFPFMRVSVVDGIVTEVRDVVNCAGYIGNTIWADKGIEGLIANDRNEDSTLKNIEFNTSSIITRTFAITDNYSPADLFLDKQSIGRLSGAWYYDESQNKIIQSNGAQYDYTHIGTCTITNGKISNLQLKSPFHAVDYNDNNLPQVDGQWVYQNALLLNTDVVTQNVTLDLSSYLPKNNYNYEVLFSGYCYTPSTAKTYVQIRIYTDIIQATVELGRVRCETGVVSHASGNAILPVGTGRKLYVLGDTAWSGSIVLNALGYRRIGKNI